MENSQVECYFMMIMPQPKLFYSTVITNCTNLAKYFLKQASLDFHLSKLSTNKQTFVNNEKENIFALFALKVCSISFPNAWWSGMVLGLPKFPLILGRKTKKEEKKMSCLYQACNQKGKLWSERQQYSLEKSMPIQMRHDINFHVVHDPALFTLVHRERLQRLPVIIKLCQDDCVVACNQRTWGVAIIL